MFLFVLLRCRVTGLFLLVYVSPLSFRFKPFRYIYDSRKMTDAFLAHDFESEEIQRMFFAEMRNLIWSPDGIEHTLGLMRILQLGDYASSNASFVWV